MGIKESSNHQEAKSFLSGGGLQLSRLKVCYYSTEAGRTMDQGKRRGPITLILFHYLLINYHKYEVGTINLILFTHMVNKFVLVQLV